MQDELTVLAGQIDVPPMTTAAERDRHMNRVAEKLADSLATAGGVDLIVLPELASLDYSRQAFDHLDVLAETLEDSPSLNRLAELAGDHSTPVLAGLARRDHDGRYYIAQVLLDADGKISACYDKLHIAQFGDSMEKEYFTRGDQAMVFEVKGFRFGVLICYDMRSPELSRHLVRHHGVDVLLHPTAFCRDETFATWHSFASTRAVENQVYFASVNRAGAEFGHSVLMHPWIDETVHNPVLNCDESLARWTISRAVLDEARARYPFLKDARDDYDQL